MLIKTLIENRSSSVNYEAEHGLCLYIEFKDKKILFDAGETDKFIQNAAKMGVDIEDIDMMILSHGHYDHGGGIVSFMEMNKKAFIYIQKEAFRKHGSLVDGEVEEVGLDVSIIDNKRIKLIDQDTHFDDMVLFSYIKGNEMTPRGNDRLLMEKDEKWENDDFNHEQNLLISEGDKRVLFVGCSHRGIVNILNQCDRHLDRPLTAVVGGFHLYDLDKKNEEDMKYLNRVTERLKRNNAGYYTGHCTGYDQYEEMKKSMGDRIQYITTGTTIEI
ncbi:MAG: MBL fold metallo-hydrolase [Bacillota bacterium]